MFHPSSKLSRELIALKCKNKNSRNLLFTTRQFCKVQVKALASEFICLSHQSFHTTYKLFIYHMKQLEYYGIMSALLVYSLINSTSRAWCPCGAGSSLNRVQCLAYTSIHCIIYQSSGNLTLQCKCQTCSIKIAEGGRNIPVLNVCVVYAYCNYKWQ